MSKHQEFEPERYEFTEAPRYRFSLSRRAFVQTVGAGILITAFAPEVGAQRNSVSGRDLSGRFRFGTDGRITAYTGKVEVGQGARTEITRAVAEELRVHPDAIDLLMADTDLVPNDGGTYGSLTTPRTIPTMRESAAAARESLIELVADHWGVHPGAVSLRDGTFESAGKTPLAMSALASTLEGIDTKLADTRSTSDALTPVGQWRVLGTPAPKVGAIEVATGARQYVSDMRLPGMLYGSVLRPPSYGAELLSVDLEPASAMRGVHVVRDGDFIGCAAPTSYAARHAVAAIARTATWREHDQPSSEALFPYLKEHISDGPRTGGREEGDVNAAMERADRIIRSAYEIAYIQHAPMETRSAVAQWEQDTLTVWAGTQRPFDVRDDLARAFNIRPGQVRLIVPDTGGGFGGKHTYDAAVEAARLARSAGSPVSLQWTRDEEFMWAYFRPAGVIEIVAALTPNGEVSGWDFVNYNSGGSALECPYAFANTRVEFVRCDSPMREGSYRALAATANNFARETFIDMLASDLGKEPLQFRLDYLREDRLKKVLKAAAEAFSWPGANRKTGERSAVGLACGTEKGSYVATCAEAEVSLRDGSVSVRRVCIAFDCGVILNPANLNAQIEGAVMMGIGGALRESIAFSNGRVTNGRFQDYKVPRFEDLPEIHVVNVVPEGVESSVGAGETPIIAIAPAIANAVFAATGRMPRSLPIHAAQQLANA